MIEEYYSQIQSVVWILLFVTGSYLLFGKVPESLALKPYCKSRRIMGVTFFIFGIQFLLQWKFNARDTFPLAASALNITFFYLASVTMGLSFISLLKRRYLNAGRVMRELALCLAVDALVWASIFFMDETVAVWVVIAAALWLFIYVGSLSWIFYHSYIACIRKIRNYYSEEVDSFIRWMSKSVFLAILMGLLCSVMAFAPKWMICLYLISAIPFFYYIFICFLDYMIDSETVEEAISTEEVPLKPEVLERVYNVGMQSSLETSDYKLQKLDSLEASIQEWIAAKGYMHNKVNMGELAKQMDTNRSYLSGYINSKYCCSFHKWIADFRIEEAKTMLLEDTELTVAQVAEKSGFSSSSHFITLFTEKEKLSPARWREENAQ